MVSMPGTRSSPRVLDEQKRTRAKSDKTEAISKPKARKTDDTQSSGAKASKNQTQNSEAKTPSEKSSRNEVANESTDEPAVKRGRGRPRKTETPILARMGSSEAGEGDNSREKRTDKHKDLIEVEKSGRRESVRGSLKSGQQTSEEGNPETETSELTKLDTEERRSTSEDPVERDGRKERIEAQTSKNEKHPVTDDGSSKATGQASRKRGRKPKKVVETCNSLETETSVDCEKLTEDETDKSEGRTVKSSSNKTDDDTELDIDEKSAKRQRTDSEGTGQDTTKSKAESPEDDVGQTSSGGTLFSPRRSGRGTMPNSRYKDMHLFSTSKKQHQTEKTGNNLGRQTDELNSKDVKGTKSKNVVDDSRPPPDSLKSSSTDSKVKEKVKLKPFSSGASMARAQAKAQQQAEAKGRAADKFGIREIARGLEVTGRDGIPVVVSPENIVRVACPTPSTSQESTKLDINFPVKPDTSEPTTDIPTKSDVQAESPDRPTTESADDSQTKPNPEVQADEAAVSVIEDLSVTVTAEDPDESEEVPVPIVSLSTEENLETQSLMSASETGIIEEVVETETEVVVSAGTETEMMDSEVRTDSGPALTSENSLSTEPGKGTVMVQGGDSGLEIGAVGDQTESVQNVPLLSVPEGKGLILSPGSGASGTKQLQSGAANTSGISDGGKMLMKLTQQGNAVVLVDKTKKLPHQFLKDTLSSMPPAKPGYVISSPRRNSSVVKIVTLSSMLEENKNKEKTEPDVTEVTSADSQTPSFSVSILKQEPEDPVPPAVTDAESRPSGVDMILASSKTVDAADAATVGTEMKIEEPKEMPASHTKDSKFSSASTQTPIDRQAEKTIIPTIYKTSPVPPLKTISVNLGKHELQEGDIGYEMTESGAKPKSEEYILVELPEGATVQQKYVKSRTKIDDSMFLHSELMVQGIYQCTMCNYETNKKSNWYKHKRKHLGFREYECNQCEYRAATSSNLKRHLAIHDDLRAFPCPQCELHFRQKIHLERHIKYKHEEKQIKCPFCEYMCANENPDLKVHIKRKHLPAQSPDGVINAFTCPECNLVTVSRRDLKQHMKFHRKGPELKLFCEHCSFVTDCESRLRRHELTHTKEKPFQCGLCEYRGSQKEHVLRHMRSMHNIDVFRRKRKSTSGDDAPAEGNPTDQTDFSKIVDKNDYTTKDKIFACNHCSMKFSKLINLYKHLHTQHRSIMPSEQEDDYSCVVCDFHTNTKKNLLVHMRKHNMNDHSPPSHLYSCVLCRYTNPKRRNLFQHMRKKHHIEIVMKDDGSTSCFVTDTSNIQEDDHNILTVGDIVTTTTADTDSQDDLADVQGVISLEDLATIVAPEPNQDGNLIIDAGQLHNTSLSSLVQQHDAAEAIEGLQALAGQINLADSVIEEVQVMDDPGLHPITMETIVETSKEGGEKPSIQLSAEHLLHLSSGDFVEINGEMYKVEITAEDSAKATPATLSDMVQSSV